MIDPQKRVNLEFYKNSLINYFWPECLLATALPGKDAHGPALMNDVRDDFHSLKQLLGPELINDPLVQDDVMMDKSLASLTRLGWTEVAEGQVATLAPEPLQCLRGILSDVLAVYYLVLIVADKLDDNGLTQKEFAKVMLKTAEDLCKGDSDRSVPSMPVALLNNALVRFGQMGILEYIASRKFVKAVLDSQTGADEELLGPGSERTAHRPRCSLLNCAPLLVKTSSPWPGTPYPP